MAFLGKVKKVMDFFFKEEQKSDVRASSHILKLAIHLSFLAFRHVRALFCEIANQSLYTSHKIANFVHLWFCEKLAVLSSLTFRENTNRLARTAKNTRWEKWLARRFTKCHLYTSRFANIILRSRQFNDKCIAGFRLALIVISTNTYILQILNRMTQVIRGVVEECQHRSTNKFWTIFYQRPIIKE